MALSIGFRNSVSFLSAIQATGLLTFAPVGLSPTEHASLRWTHPRARLVQSRAALCASVVIIEGFLIYLQRCWLLGQVRAPRNQRPAGNTSTATAASGIVPAHCGPPTASGFHLCSVNLGLQRIAGGGPRSCTLPDRWHSKRLRYPPNKEASSIDSPCRNAHEGGCERTRRRLSTFFCPAGLSILGRQG